MPHHSTRLANYALAQSTLVVMIAPVTVMTGALIGTLLNASITEYELSGPRRARSSSLEIWSFR